jgi:hypothetical protein
MMMHQKNKNNKTMTVSVSKYQSSNLNTSFTLGKNQSNNLIFWMIVYNILKGLND